MVMVSSKLMKNNIKKRIIIIGATSSIAQYCARIWSSDKIVELVLVGRNSNKIKQLAIDLKTRSPKSKIIEITANFTYASDIDVLVKNIASNGNLDLVLIAHGSLPNQQICQQKLNTCADELLINGLSPVLCAEAFIGYMEKNNSGTLAVIGSIAGDKGKKSNYTYGAAKGMIAIYVQGLQHRLATSKVKVVLIKPGPTETQMTSHLKQKGIKLAGVEGVAEDIVNGIEKGKPVIYTPSKWMIIMMIIRNLPRIVFNKMNI